MSPHTKRLSPENESTIRRMVEEGASNPTISEAIGFSPGTVSRFRNRHGIGGKLSIPTELTDAMISEISERYLSGEGFTKLGKEYRVSPERVKTILMGLGISIRANEHPEETRSEVMRLHKESNLFRHQIETLFDISETAYTQWTHGIARQNAPKQINPMIGQHFYDVWIRKYGQEEADRRMNEFKRDCSKRTSGSKNSMYGKPSPDGSGNGWKGWYRDFYFRSFRELTFLIQAERDEVSWTPGEKLSIPYIFDGTERTYRPDFIVGARMIELKPQRLIKSPAVQAKADAAREYCAANGLTYEIFDPGIDSDLIQHAYEAGLVRFVGDYEQRFLDYITPPSSP